MADHFARAFSLTGGQTLESYEITGGESDFSAFVRRLPRDFDVLFYGGTFEGAALLRAMRRHGLDQRLATGDGCWDVKNFLSPAGEVAEQGEGALAGKRSKKSRVLRCTRRAQ
jgi:branched-chain amino acid transport system substrate-binding protein